MAHPKRKISKQRKNKRRTHYKAVTPSLATCSATGAIHVPHRAYNIDGNLYYNGKLVIENTQIG